MLMEMFLKEIGKMIKLMEKVFIFTEMELVILENGLRINNMEQDLRNGLTILLIREAILWV
jgi:hypothetical protein